MANKYGFKVSQCPQCGRDLSQDKVEVDSYVTWADGRGRCPGCGASLQVDAPPNKKMMPEGVEPKGKPTKTEEPPAEPEP